MIPFSFLDEMEMRAEKNFITKKGNSRFQKLFGKWLEMYERRRRKTIIQIVHIFSYPGVGNIVHLKRARI